MLLADRPRPTIRDQSDMTVLFVGVAGAIGSLLRYGIASAVGERGSPWAVLGINLLGSLLLGALAAAAEGRGWSDEVTVPVAVGFLGAFTTFSTFSNHAQLMLRDGRVGAVLVYVGVSVLGGIAAAGLGYAVADAAA